MLARGGFSEAELRPPRRDLQGRRASLPPAPPPGICSLPARRTASPAPSPPLLRGGGLAGRAQGWASYFPGSRQDPPGGQALPRAWSPRHTPARRSSAGAPTELLGLRGRGGFRTTAHRWSPQPRAACESGPPRPLPRVWLRVFTPAALGLRGLRAAEGDARSPPALSCRPARSRPGCTHRPHGAGGGPGGRAGAEAGGTLLALAAAERLPVRLGRRCGLKCAARPSPPLQRAARPARLGGVGSAVPRPDLPCAPPRGEPPPTLLFET